MGYIGKDRDELYAGPVIAELTGLTEIQKEAIAAHLGLEPVKPDQEHVEEPVEESVEETELNPALEALGEESQENETEDPTSQGEDELEGAIEDVELQPTYCPEMDNQAVINAFYLAALKLEINGHELISTAELSNLSEKRTATYAGPNIEDLPGITEEQKQVIAELLQVDLSNLSKPTESVQEETEPVEQVEEPNPEDVHEEEQDNNSGEDGGQEEKDPVKPTYMGLVNQDIIDLFYEAASVFNENGWDWIVRTGLGYMAENRRIRFQMYAGPKISQISGLSKQQKELLVEKFDRYRQ